MDMSTAMASGAKIEDFEKRLIVPFFEEVKASRRLADRTFHIVSGSHSGDARIDELLQIMHPDRAFLEPKVPVASSAPETRFVGRTLVVVNPGSQPHPDAGKFFLSVTYRCGPGGDVYTSPYVMYYMRFDGKLHQFDHRYDATVAAHRVEDVTRAQVLNHMLDSFQFYEMHAGSPDSPW